jgi:hypothetical protein
LILIEDRMRFAALLIALCTIPAIAGAQSTDCRAIASSMERLACYDNRPAPPAAQASSASRAAAPPVAARPVSAEQRAPVGDVLEIENARLDAKIKGICRGC